MRDLHRCGSGLAVGGLRRAACRRRLSLIRSAGRRRDGLTRAWRRILLALLNRGHRLGGDLLHRLGVGNCRCRSGPRLARSEKLGVEVGGRPIAGEAVTGPVRLLALRGRLARGRIVRCRTAGNGERGCKQRSSSPDASPCTVQAIPPDRKTGRSTSNKGRIWRPQGKPSGLGCRNWRGARRFHAEPLIYQHQPACKPGSVGPCPLSRTRRDGHSSGTALARGLEQPTRMASLTSLPQALSLSRTTRVAIPIRSCSRWGLPCRFRCRTRGALLPHLFTLAASRGRKRFVLCGTFPGVAPAGRYPAPYVDGARTFLSLSEAAVRPTDVVGNGIYCGLRQGVNRRTGVPKIIIVKMSFGGRLNRLDVGDDADSQGVKRCSIS